MEVRKVVRLRVVGDNENLKELEKLLTTWRYSVWQKRKGINIEDLKIPTTFKHTIKLYDNFTVPMFHPIFDETGFSINFENNEVKLTSLEKYKRISLRINEENMEYLKKEITNRAKPTMSMVLPPSYLKGHHKRREIIRNKHWKLHIVLRKNIELLTKEEFKKFQKIAVIGVDLNSKYGVAYSLWIWNVKEDSLKPIKARFLPKIKSHQFQELEKWKLQMNHGNSVKYNKLWQRINAKIRRQNKDWIEKMSKMLIDIALKSIKEYNCEIAIISFEELKDYEARNNSKKINKKNTEWLRKIVKRTFEKSLWNYSMKILTYLPTFNKNQRNLKQILIDSYNTSKKCYRCGNFGKFGEGKESYKFICENCGIRINKHFNSANNIAKRTAEILRKINIFHEAAPHLTSSEPFKLRRGLPETSFLHIGVPEAPHQ